MFCFAVETLDDADTQPQARYENTDLSSSSVNPTQSFIEPNMVQKSVPHANIVQVNSSEDLTAFIRDFVQQSTMLNTPEPRSRFIKTLEDDTNAKNDIGPDSTAGESIESELTATKLETISKKLVDYISRQRTPAQQRSEEESATRTTNVPADGGLSVSPTAEKTAALPALPAAESLTKLQLPQVVEVYINGQLQSSDTETKVAGSEKELTVSQLSSQYLGQVAKKVFFLVFRLLHTVLTKDNNILTYLRLKKY